jgi:Zn-dependent peptidase ImmA (M78 family)
MLVLPGNATVTTWIKTMTDWDGARDKAKEVSRRYNITAPPVDVFQIAADEGIEVRYFDPDDDSKLRNISGVLDKTGAKYVVFLNKNESPERQAFTLGHELGHYFMKHKPRDIGVYYRNSLYDDTKPNAEKEADCFAAEILMPDELIRNFMKAYGLTKDDVRQLAIVFGVSPKAMRYRLKSL